VAVELGLGEEVGAGALDHAEAAVAQAGADGHDAGAAFVVGRAHGQAGADELLDLAGA
jgi:hypothetical protein